MTHRMEGKPCPRCEKLIDTFPSLSRRDNETFICPDCGNAEGYEDAKMVPAYKGKRYWRDVS